MLTRIFTCFAAGYFVSYSFRSVGALIAPELASELALSANELGLLGSAFFLTFAALQIPFGIALDRFGPRRVNGSLFVLAASGMVAFALSDSFASALFARAAVGAGVAVALMSAFKSLVIWYPPERRETLSGWMMAVGGVGATIVASPAEWLMRAIGWRGVIGVLAVAAISVALLIWLCVPDPPIKPATAAAPAAFSFAALFTDWRFLRYLPLAFFGSGGFSAIQSLWAGPFLVEGMGHTRASAAHVLLLFGIGMTLGYLLIGPLAGWLNRQLRDGGDGRSGAEWLYIGGLLCAQGTLGIIATNWVPHSTVPWFVYGATLGTSMLAYPTLSKTFPSEISARVMTTYNVLMFSGTFALQWGMGAAIDSFIAHGLTKTAAYQWTFGCVVIAQMLSVLCFWAAPRGAR